MQSSRNFRDDYHLEFPDHHLRRGSTLCSVERCAAAARTPGSPPSHLPLCARVRVLMWALSYPNRSTDRSPPPPPTAAKRQAEPADSLTPPLAPPPAFRPRAHLSLVLTQRWHTPRSAPRGPLVATSRVVGAHVGRDTTGPWPTVTHSAADMSGTIGGAYGARCSAFAHAHVSIPPFV